MTITKRDAVKAAFRLSEKYMRQNEKHLDDMYHVLLWMNHHGITRPWLYLKRRSELLGGESIMDRIQSDMMISEETEALLIEEFLTRERNANRAS